MMSDDERHTQDGRLKRGYYEEELRRLQIELVKVQYWIRASGHRLVVLFEGRDGAHSTTGGAARANRSSNRPLTQSGRKWIRRLCCVFIRRRAPSRGIAHGNLNCSTQRREDAKGGAG